MVRCGNCGGGIWRCLACIRAKGQCWDLDQPMGSSPRRMDQPMGSRSRQVDQPMGSWSSWRSMDQSVVSDLLDIFACPRKIIRLSGFYRLLWQRDKVTGLLLPSSAVGKNFVDGCAIHYPA